MCWVMWASGQAQPAPSCAQRHRPSPASTQLGPTPQVRSCSSPRICLSQRRTLEPRTPVDVWCAISRIIVQCEFRGSPCRNGNVCSTTSAATAASETLAKPFRTFCRRIRCNACCSAGVCYFTRWICCDSNVLTAASVAAPAAAATSEPSSKVSAAVFAAVATSAPS